MTARQREWAFRLALFVFGSLSIDSLLLYFFGVASFVTLTSILLTIEAVALAALAWVAWRQNWTDAKRLLLAGLWAGCLATFAYDIVRVPIVHSGVPVLKAISYFGTVLLGIERPTPWSEFLGWAYHFSNGVSFALMYAAIAVRPGPVTAMLWGLSLEGTMLVTPYAEVFGYQRDARFLAITIGSHLVYGMVIWLALRQGPASSAIGVRKVAAGLCVVPLGLAAMATDFNARYAPKIPQSPPPYLGSHLYTMWNVPEPDRVAAVWVMKRFVDPEAVFALIEPFDRVKFGTPFDIPEAAVRRSATQSATEKLVLEQRLQDPRVLALAHVTSLTEITPWLLASDPDAGQLAERMRREADVRCGKSLTNSCLPLLLDDLDRWYDGAAH